MTDYQDIIQQLLEHKMSPQDECLCISLYQPNDNLSKQQMFQRLKSLLNKALKESDRFKNLEMKRDVTEALRKAVQNSQRLLGGLAVFLSLEKNGGQAGLSGSLLVVLPLGNKPVQEYQSGYHFDLDQLIMISNAVSDALVIDIKRKKAWVYAYHEQQLELIEQLENEHIGEVPDRHLEKYGPTGRDDGIYHSTGNDKYDRRRLKQNELFLQDVLDKIDHYPYDFQHLAVFYSNSFAEFIDPYLKDLDDSLYQKEVIAVNKNIKKRELFRKEVKQILASKIKQHKIELIKEVEDDYHAVVKKWEDILEAARNGQIQRLIIRPNLSMKGYVTVKDQLLYVGEPELKAVAVDNIVPWLVNSVVRQDGQVIVMTEEELEGRPHKLAQLRYKVEEE